MISLYKIHAHRIFGAICSNQKNICDDVKIWTSLYSMNVFLWNIQKEKTHSQAPTNLSKPCLQLNLT